MVFGKLLVEGGAVGLRGSYLYVYILHITALHILLEACLHLGILVFQVGTLYFHLAVIDARISTGGKLNLCLLVLFLEGGLGFHGI